MAGRRVPGSETCQEPCVHSDLIAAACAGLEGNEAYIDLAELFGALADSTRAKIVHLLLRQELCTCDIAAILGVTDSCVSQHLRVLRSLRLVKSRREGKFVYYSLDDAHISLLVQIGLTHLGHGDNGKLEVSRPVAMEGV